MTKTGEAARPTPTIEAEDLGETWILYRKQIIGGVLVVAAAVTGWYLWQRSAEIKEEKAAAAFATAESAFLSGNKPLAQSELERIVGRYKGTTAGTQAAMLMAQTLFEQGKYAEGITQLETARSSAPRSLVAGIESLIGAGLEGSAKPAEAAVAYGNAAAAAQFDIDADMYRMEQARALLVSGDRAAAQAIYAEVAAREDSPFAGEARVRLGELKAK